MNNGQNVFALTPRQLRRAALIKERLERLRLELAKILNGAEAEPHHRMSAAGKRRLARIVRARWAAAKKAGQKTL